MSLAFDEYGRPFIVIKEQDSKVRIKGIDAIKVRQFLFRGTFLPPSQSPIPSDHLLAPRDLISFWSPPTKKSLSPMMAPPLSTKWKSSTLLPDYLLNFQRVRIMKLEMEPQASLCWQGLSSNRQKNFLIRVLNSLTPGLHPLKISDGFDIASEVASKRL